MSKLLPIIIVVLVSVTACKTQNLNAYSAEKPTSTQEKHVEEVDEKAWVPLMEGMKTSYNANYEYHSSEMQLNNGTVLRQDDWDYIKELTKPFPAKKQDIIVNGLSKHYTDWDKVEQKIVFSPVRYHNHPYASSSYIGLIGSIKSNAVETYAKLKYYGSDWLFVNSVKVVADGKELASFSVDVKRDNYGGNVWEYALLPLSNPKHRKLIENIIAAQDVIIRFYGDQHYDDLKVSDRMKEDMGAMLEALDTIEQGT